MKLKLKKWICTLLVGSFLGFSSCGDDDTDDLIKIPETPTNPSSPSGSPKDYTFLKGYSWSAVAYHDVTLAEIHSTVSDYSLSCNPPEGYTLQLRKLPSKDDAGYNVYRIVCDMEAVTQTTSSNENVKLEIPYTLTGSYISDGKTEIWKVKNSVNFQRFMAPDKEVESNFFSNFWYLSEYTTNSNADWVNFASESSYTEEGTTSVAYSSESSPIKRVWQLAVLEGVLETGETYTRYQPYPAWECRLTLPGWVESKDFNDEFINTRFVYPDYPLDYGSSVYMVTDQVMWCMKAVYSDSGELQQVYHYKFNRYEPQRPEIPEN
ncbi:MAG: hypothetical protein K2M69_09665 [Muribaculaceae bacterium]|nr:hypothetical protein [Muribaculaceae bacterium]